MASFGTKKFHDAVGDFDVGSTLQFIASSASGSVSGTVAQDLSKFQKYIYKMYLKGNATQPTLMLFSASTSASASSNWSVIDSANCAVTMSSASASVSTRVFETILEVRAEKLFSGTTPIRYILPVVVIGSTVSNGSSSCQGFVTCQGVTPDFDPASYMETAGFVTNEAYYL